MMETRVPMIFVLQTNYTCSHSVISDCCGNKICESKESYSDCANDCPNCDDGNNCTRDHFNYENQTCVNEAMVPCCGNDKCDTGETFSSCPKDCKHPEPSELVLTLSDLPGGYEVYARGERVKSDVRKDALNIGWINGYFVDFKKESGINPYNEIVLSNQMSIYPEENISKVLNTSRSQLIPYKYNSITQTVKRVGMLSSPAIGDESIAYRITIEDTYGTLISKVYQIEFVKLDIYEVLTGLDYDLLKDAARKLEAKI